MSMHQGLQPAPAPEVDALTATLWSMPVAAMITDSGGTVEWVNTRFSQLAGYSEEEIGGRFAWSPEGADGVVAGPDRLRAVVETGTAWSGEVVWQCRHTELAGHGRDCREGRGCLLEETVTPIRDAGGTITHALWTLHNVSREVAAISDLEQLNQTFAAAQKAARFGVFRWNAKTGVCTWSDATWQMYGLDPATTTASIEAWLETVHVADRERSMASVRESIQSPAKRLQVQYRSTDGARWIALNGQLFRDPEGKPDFLAGICMDVTERVQLETALQVSEERLTLAIDAASDGIWDWNAETNKVYFSSAWKQMLGYSDEEVGDGFSEWEDRLHPDDRGAVYGALNAHLEGLTPQYTSECRLRCKDGSWKWILARGKVASTGADGKALRIVGAHTDISKQKHLEEELRQREENARSLFENMREAVVSCRVVFEDGKPTDWIYEEVNSAFKEMVGVAKPEGRRVSEVVPGLLEANPEFAEIFGGVSLSGIPAALEKLVAPLNRWLSVSVYSPRRGYFVAVMENITARKESELALKKSHELLTNLACLVPGVIYQYRQWPDGRSAFPYSSPGMYGIYEVRPEEVQEDATRVFGRLHPDDAAGVAGAINESARTLQPFYCEFRVILPEQGLRWRWSQAHPERTADGGTLWHGIILDVTERHKSDEDKARLTAQLIQAQKMESVGRLAGGVAHDFNNLLTVISGYSGFLLAKLTEEDPLHKFADEIARAGERAAALTKQLLAFSRKQVIAPKLLNVNATIRDSVPMLGRLIGEDVEFRTDLCEEPGLVLADPGQIHQVVMNLAVNARDAMPDGGNLEITTANVELSDEEAFALDPDAVGGKYIEVTVTDTGTGMDEETLRQIFEPFFTTKEAGKGTGLGLATVFGIVRQSNGWITVQSKPDEGTRFRIYLPEVEGCTLEETKKLDGASSAGHETILVVEDQEGVRAFTKAVLEHHGYEVLEAGEGEESLRVAAGHPGRIHLLVTDVVLPGMNGKMVSEKLLAKYPGLRVIFCSGYTSDLIQQRGVLQQGTMFLQKPFQPEELLAKVREVLDAGLIPASL